MVSECTVEQLLIKPIQLCFYIPCHYWSRDVYTQGMRVRQSDDIVQRVWVKEANNSIRAATKQVAVG